MARAQPPDVSRVDTRLLESRHIVRGFVRQARVTRAEAGVIELETVGARTARRTRMADVTAGRRADFEADTTGRLRVDVLSGGVFRVRYTEGDVIPAGDTPMIADLPDLEPADVTVSDDRVTCRTTSGTLEIDLKPLTIRIVDPAGREVFVAGGREKNHFNTWDSYNTGICRTVHGDRPVAVECFTLHPQDAIFGLGEQFGPLNKVGQTIDLNMVEATGTTTPRSYKNIPFYVSTNGYGLYVNSSARMTFWVGTLCMPDVQLAVEDDHLDYFVILGDIHQVLHCYTSITGCGPVPPDWSFGYWQSKISYGSAEETLEVARAMRDAHIPMDVIHVDTNWFRDDWYCDLEFNGERFPDPKAWMDELRELGVKVSLWQLPYIPDGSKLFDDLQAVDGFVKTASGELYDVGICYTRGFDGRVGCIDFTSPDARRVYTDALRRLFDAGAKVIKVDFGEQAPLDGVYHDGTPGHLMHNLYPLLYNQTVSEAAKDATGEQVIWARSAWAGSQRYPVHWGGDSSTNWHNIVPQMHGGLSLGMSGFQFWSMDIGGFLGATGGDMLVRWMQAGMFLSHSRIHGAGRRELYAFPPEVTDPCREAIELRYRLLPYIWGQAADCVERSLPMARPLVVEFQDDPTTWPIGDQWLFGDSLLVAPLFDPSGKRRVYLPEGTWTDWWTGEPVDGSRWIQVDAPIDRVPLWVREGAVIAMGPLMQFVGQAPIDKVTLRVACMSSDGSRSFLFGTGGGELVRGTYRRAGGNHTVTIDTPTLDVVVDVLDHEGLEIRVDRHR